jgi:DDE family transposase
MKRVSLRDHFSALEDPRQRWKTVYPLPEIQLPEIQLIVLCGVMAGADDFVQIARWGARKIAFLRRFLPFSDGIPSHDTRERRDERLGGRSARWG